MSYDLYVWPIDSPIGFAQAKVILDAWFDEDHNADATPREPRLAAFATDLQARFPAMFPTEADWERGWQPSLGDPVFEINEGPHHTFLGIGFSSVARVGSAVQAIAAEHDLVVVDPQAEAVILPPRFGGAQVDWGVDPTAEELAAQQAEWMAQAPPLDPSIDPNDEMAMHAEMLRSITADGGEMWSPMGFQVTEDTIADMFDDPSRVPPSLQTPERKAQLLVDISSKKRGPRSMALTQLSGWDPDPDVATALRGLLSSDDEFERWMAAGGLARQRSTEDLDAVLGVVRRASPAEGGSTGSMYLPVQSALELATLLGPDAVERVRTLATEWRGPAPTRPNQFDRELDDLLAG